MMLIFPILIIPFNITSFASENLIDSNLRNWHILNYEGNTTISPSFDNSFVVGITPTPNTDGDLFIKMSAVYSLPDNFVAGNSYSFKFHLLSLDEINSAIHTGPATIYDGIIKGGGSFFIGLATLNGSDDLTVVDNCHIVINKDNYLQYFGKDSVVTFTLPNIVNPCIVISYMEVSSRNVPQYYYIRDISLVDNDNVEEDNFFSRLFEWFEVKFQAIGDSFSSLGDRISSFFSSLGDRISGFFADLKQSVIEIKDKFTEGINNIIEWFQNKFQQLFNIILYLDPDGKQDYTNPFAPDDNDVNGGDNLQHLQNAIDKFVSSVENLTSYLRVPSEMLTTLGKRFPLIPIIVVFTLVGLVVMRLFGVRRDS